MCGIFGVVGLGGSVVVDKAIAQLRHRGPDASATFVDPEGRCALGHTRLAIIDLSAGGYQPRHSDDARYTIVFNGEIYNFAQIRAELADAGEHCASTSDTEVLLRAHVRWGKNAMSRLRGMFAYAVWDRKERRLFLARDRFGVKPLYVMQRDGVFAFSSELRTLLDTGLAARRLHRPALLSYLRSGSVEEPDTIIEGVRMLPCGSWLEMDAEGQRAGTYWELPLEHGAFGVRDDYVAEIRHLLETSVRMRMVADVPVGVFLSGGIDSSAIVSVAARVSDRPIHTFTVVLQDSMLNEASYAATVARRYGCHHQEVSMSSEVLRDSLQHALAALDQPSSDGPNTYFVSEATRHAGLRVALSGIGGDEVFAGYRYFRLFRMARKLAALRAPYRACRAVLPASVVGKLPTSARKLLWAIEPERTASDVYRSLRSMFDEHEVQRLVPSVFGPRVPTAEDLRIGAALTAGDLDDTAAYSAFELGRYLRNTLLRDTDVMSMAHGLEVREPLLDHVLVEHVLRIPEQHKLDSTVNKPLLVSAAGDLPRSATHRKKMGFTLAFDAWLRGPLRGWAQERLNSNTCRALFAEQEVDRLWNRFLANGRQVTHARIWTLLAMTDWCERHHVEL